MTSAFQNAIGAEVPVKLTPAGAVPTVMQVADSTGALFNPDACSHVYAYNASGLVTTDTATDGTATWVKTYSYTGANLTGETKWVKQ
jgi:hypothetical protein